MKGAIIGAALLATVGATAYYGRTLVWKLSSPAADVPTITVQAGPFTRVVQAEGTLKPLKTTALTAPREGRNGFLIDWIQEDGASVKKGDLLVRFDPSDATRVLADGKDERAAADQRIAKEQTLIDSTLADRQRTAQLMKAELASAKQLGKKDPRFFPRNEVIESQIDEGLYNERITKTEAAQTVEKRLAKSRIALLAVERKKADINSQQAQAALKALEMRSPHDGTFLIFRRNDRILRSGDRSWPGMWIGEVATNDRMDAEVFVLEADAGGLAVGKRAEVVLEARPDQIWKGTVKRVDPFPKPQRPEVPAQYFGTLIELEGDTSGLKPGQRLHARIVLEELPQAIAVPRQAVFTTGSDETIVYKRRGGAFVPVPVKLGAGTVGRIVVAQGVSPGDVLALRDPTRSAEEAVADPGKRARGGAGGRGKPSSSGLLPPAGGGTQP